MTTLYISTLEDITSRAILITKDTDFYNPSFKKTETLNPNIFSPAYRMRYACHNNIVSFIDEWNNWYIIPNIAGVISTLKHFGFLRASFYVPCSENYSMPFRSYPIKEKEKWDTLLAQIQS